MTAVLRVRPSDDVKRFERVYIREDGAAVAAGQFMGISGFTNPYWVVAVPNWRNPVDIIHVPIDSEDVFITDACLLDGCGRVIRRDATPDTFPAGY